MTPTTMFSFANFIVMPMWLLMIFLPKWKLTRYLIDFKVIPIVLSAIYIFYIIQSMMDNGLMDFGSLASVKELFTKENAVLAGWIHYLAFDLLVGMWMVTKNKELGIHKALMAPCLFFTFMFGPLGFLLFMTLKTIKNKIG